MKIYDLDKEQSELHSGKWVAVDLLPKKEAGK